MNAPPLNWLRWFLEARLLNEDGTKNQVVYALAFPCVVDERTIGRRLYEFDNPERKLLAEQARLRDFFEKYLIRRRRLTTTVERRICSRFKIPEIKRTDPSHAFTIKDVVVTDVSGINGYAFSLIFLRKIVSIGFRNISSTIREESLERIAPDIVKGNEDGEFVAYSEAYGKSAIGGSSPRAIANLEKEIIREYRSVPEDAEGVIKAEEEMFIFTLPAPQPAKKDDVRSNVLGCLYHFVLEEAKKGHRYRYCQNCDRPFWIYPQTPGQKYCPPDISQYTAENLHPDGRCGDAARKRRQRKDPRKSREYNRKQKLLMRKVRSNPRFFPSVSPVVKF